MKLKRYFALGYVLYPYCFFSYYFFVFSPLIRVEGLFSISEPISYLAHFNIVLDIILLKMS